MTLLPLKQARIDSRKTIDEVASYLKIKRQYLVALEEDKMELLPAEVYTKGYIKLYSNYLGLKLSSVEGEDNIEEITKSAKKTNLRTRQNKIILNYKWKKHIIIISILLLILLSIIFNIILSSE
ncbi:MAG: helix-turn-helix domain-containing protein [Rickettsia endosymbiont of Bryobia graminum]|nr:helix-turn-helix domain-containing protein [Rickettsia endosymbiont of Bryobia graminum]